MKIVIQNQDYIIRFMHRNRQQDEVKGTEATLLKYLGENNIEETGIVGTAILSRKDSFNKAKGRKVALAKLIKVMKENKLIDKTDATALWELYFSQFKNTVK